MAISLEYRLTNDTISVATAWRAAPDPAAPVAKPMVLFGWG
jgi:hypothetical protein